MLNTFAFMDMSTKISWVDSLDLAVKHVIEETRGCLLIYHLYQL